MEPNQSDVTDWSLTSRNKRHKVASFEKLAPDLDAVAAAGHKEQWLVAHERQKTHSLPCVCTYLCTMRVYVSMHHACVRIYAPCVCTYLCTMRVYVSMHHAHRPAVNLQCTSWNKKLLPIAGPSAARSRDSQSCRQVAPWSLYRKKAILTSIVCRPDWNVETMYNCVRGDERQLQCASTPPAASAAIAALPRYVGAVLDRTILYVYIYIYIYIAFFYSEPSV